MEEEKRVAKELQEQINKEKEEKLNKRKETLNQYKQIKESNEHEKIIT